MQEAKNAVEVDFINSIEKDTLIIEDTFESKHISLKNNKNLYLDELTSVYFSDLIYLFDQKDGGRLFTFEERSQNLEEITKKGKGPGEYPFIQSVFVNDYIYINAGPLLCTYNKKNELVAKYSSIDVQSSSFAIKENMMFCCNMYGSAMSSKFPELSQYNLTTRKHTKILPFINLGVDQPGRPIIGLGQKLVINQDGEVLFSRRFENIIYKILNGKTYVKYKIKLTNTNDYVLKKDEKYFDNPPALALVGFVETKNNLYVNVIKSKKRNNYLLVHNKFSNRNVRYPIVWSEKFRARLIINQMCNEYLIGSFDSFVVSNLLNKSKSILSDENAALEDIKWAKFILDITGGQVNPILIMLKEKNQ